MLKRRDFVSAIATTSLIPAALLPTGGFTAELPVPDALKNTKNQLYNFLLEIVQAQGIASTQKVVLNNTIIPFDLSTETPYYNEELFRLFADRTFSRGVDEIVPSTPVSQTTRFSSQYRILLNLAASQIDQNQPKIDAKVKQLQQELKIATNAYNKKAIEFETAWSKLAAIRKLTAKSTDVKAINEYQSQKARWYADINWSDQIKTYTDDIISVNNQIDAVRRSAYTLAEQAVLDNIGALSGANNIARPWNAQTELTNKNQGTPLTDLFLADPTHCPPALYDSSPLIFPAGNLSAFLTNTGNRGFDTKTTKSTVETGSGNWSGGGSGGGSFLGISFGGGGGSGGASSYSHAISSINSMSVDFKNIAEYYADRSAWFNPAVLQDASIRKRLRSRKEFDNLRFIAVSVIIIRGMTLKLGFSEKVNNSDWSEKSIAAQGGASFFGFRVGGSGSSTTSKTTVTVDDTGTNVTFQDGDNVCRVIGVRIEPFVDSVPIEGQRIDELAKTNPDLKKLSEGLKKGQNTYIELQKAKINAIVQ